MGYGIIKESNSKYYITINAVEKYIEFHAEKKPNSKTERWSQISVRRNTLETNLRQVVKTGLKYTFGKKAKEKLLAIIEESRKSKLSSIEFDEIFSEHLYFMDLKKLVIKYWSSFQNVFNDKIKFELHTDFINKHRIDAHAKDISEEDFSILMISVKYLEDSIKDYS